ncbi:hypothetical protein AhnVgp015 [Adoxophyes honmai nucleopolyhedrovirus]|uniref:Uncharacterized protein n=1 Tax=Adoxophyes honmai nucleopolyhedrovirus TaxID=224399 RepID=Q80LT1_NPVAH|nr:hypothetical protein AhnVgp015 [Adoxophyes honmai nucleopolyhedrovirus]BAC67266.1 hypothetical protein [Adoxophyes honmai nucleopolyhedrovirus]
MVTDVQVNDIVKGVIVKVSICGLHEVETESGHNAIFIVVNPTKPYYVGAKIKGRVIRVYNNFIDLVPAL